MPIRVYTSLEGAFPCGKSSVALGFFDGLHIGHAAVIQQAVKKAKNGYCPCVFTFTIHGGHPEAKREDGGIITERQKRMQLEQWGVRLVLEPDFAEFQTMSPDQFVEEVLVKRMNAGVVCCGSDFHFGYRASAGIKELSALCKEKNIDLEIVPPVMFEGERVSSTRIRTLLAEGNVRQAVALLGRPFSYDFTVVPGRQLGRKLDFPTINQVMPKGFIQLRRGVYASYAVVDGIPYPAVTNIGIRPTVDANARQVVSETSIQGISQDLYGKNVNVSLLKFIRAEQLFPSVQVLQKQMEKDSACAFSVSRRYLDSAVEKQRIDALQSAHTML